MKQLFFGLKGNEDITASLCTLTDGELADFTQRQFPDGETYLRITSPVEGKECVLVCSLHQPDDKIIPLYYLASLCKEQGAAKVTLIAPYLAYMRQDKKFNPGEGVTSEYFAQLLSQWVDELITIDPHLHRKHGMAELYSIPCEVLHATVAIAGYIKKHIQKAVLIGPDSESEQWVSHVATQAGVPFIVLEKARRGDRDVEVSVPDVDKFTNHTPVLVDDIISTAHTMIETVGHLRRAGMKPPTCIGVHAIFAGSAYEELVAAGAGEIITCNTIPHKTNLIDISGLIGEALSKDKKAFV